MSASSDSAIVAQKLRWNALTALVSLLFALIGFSYNAWRLEASEANSTVRTAAFEVLLQLSELEQNIFAAHYDQDRLRGNPRDGWVKVGLIDDLSGLIDGEVAQHSQLLRQQWQVGWQRLPDDRAIAEQLLTQIDATRAAIKRRLNQLE
ncbi:hypothetical protein [Ferrimonas senticii]|uniref:hypothetical protein n=1 Tax=Ferrimonas senticii TaxID=394566 RepID=UPI00040521B9|nr:hypothetical protein [Ferrimonas senticii]